MRNIKIQIFNDHWTLRKCDYFNSEMFNFQGIKSYFQSFLITDIEDLDFLDFHILGFISQIQNIIPVSIWKGAWNLGFIVFQFHFLNCVHSSVVFFILCFKDFFPNLGDSLTVGYRITLKEKTYHHFNLI